MTPAIILETGFMTSPHDQRVLIYNPKNVAQGIVRGLLEFLGLDNS